MKSRRLILFITVVSLLISLIGAVPVSAEENLTWDFSDAVSQTGPKTAIYNGISVLLANTSDTISTSGISFNGGAELTAAAPAGQNARYVKITTATAGTITATDSAKSVKIAVEGATSSLGNSNSGTLSIALEAGKSYYIYPTKATVIRQITYTGTIVEPEPEPEEADPIIDSVGGSKNFLFGNNEPADDEIKIAGGTYAIDKQYGFTTDSALTVNDDNITSDSAFTFNVRVKNGNYDIALGTTASSVTYEKIQGVTADIKRTTTKKNFTAAVCDGTLDITIPAGESLSSLSITNVTKTEAREKPYLFAVGDSTVNTTENGSKTWGVCIDEGIVTLPDVFGGFVNCGYRGADSATFYMIDQTSSLDGTGTIEPINRFDQLMLNIQPGDYVTVNMGINKNRVSNESGAYMTIMRDYICKGIIDRGATPVILTATPRGPVNTYADKNYLSGVFYCNRSSSVSDDKAHNDDLRSIANELKLDLIDVGAWGDDYFNSLRTDDIGNAESVLAYVQAMYADHNHYKESLGTKIAAYVTSSVATIISAKDNNDRVGTASSVTQTVSGEAAKIDTSSLPSGGNVTAYEVTLSKNGRKLRSTRVPASETVYTEAVGADKVDVVPVYRYENIKGMKDTNKALGSFEDGLYNMTFQRSGRSRADIYVNDAMVANNIDQVGTDGSPSSGTAYTANNIKITGGSINVKMADTSLTDMSYVEVVKAPPSVTRKTKIFTIGDSLVCNYYRTGKNLGANQTGWGQELYNFINTDKYEVVNLANSGETANGLYTTAFTGVTANSQAGDILLFESGYNDATKSTETEMTTAANNIVDEAKAAGIVPVLLNPNATPEEYNSVVKFGNIMKSVASDKGTKFIDLSRLTYNYLYSLYDSDTTLLKKNLALSTSDNTHTSYVGAMKYASIIANELYKMYKNDSTYSDMIDAEYTYTKTDTEGNSIVCNALLDVSTIADPESPETPDPTDEDTGVYEWDFSEYSTKVSGTTAGVTETYDAPNASNPAKTHQQLVIKLGKDADTVTTSGVYWDGGTSANREIAYTPAEDGTLYVTGKSSRSDGSWGIALSNGGTYQKSSSGTASVKLSLSVTGGTTYYIYPKTRPATISHIEFIKNGAKQTYTATFNNMYGDNMLLQREKPIYVDGTADKAEKVRVALTKDDDDSYKNEQEAAVSDGQWNVTLDAVTLGDAEAYRSSSYTLTVTPVSSDENVTAEADKIENIKFGDLYLCGGQSNMWYHLNRYIGVDFNETDIDAYTNENIRIMQQPTASDGAGITKVRTPRTSLASAADWEPLTPDYAKSESMSALVYSIAKELYEETGVPVGMMDTAVGETTIADWMRDDSHDTWYALRIHPLRNFAISGIFWYQGCSDKDNESDYYEKKMTSFISEYRSLFGGGKIPFYYVQLARNGSTYPDTTEWKNQDTAGMKNIRLAQMNTYLNAADKTNLGIASTLDIYGVYNAPEPLKTNSNFSARINYHTAQKAVIAHRLAAWALKDIYQMDKYRNNTTIYTHGPIYKSKVTSGNALVVTFETTGDLKIMDKTQYADSVTDAKIEAGTINPAIVNEFEIAGADGVYYPASAEISGNKVTLTSSEVSVPVSVHYAYSQYPESPNLTDDSGLPTYAFTAEEINYPSWKFDFGTGAENDGFIRVDKDQTYGGDSKDYGFLGITEESAAVKDVVDGYKQTADTLTTLVEGNDYIKSNNKQLPIRFAMKVTPNTYYKVKVTLAAEGGDANATLTSERRHLVLAEQTITSGETLTKEFTVAVHNVRWKDTSNSRKPANYTDDMLNVGVVGENTALKSIEIQQIVKPKVLWIFGDSTVTDHVTDMPLASCTADTGWGAAAAKYLDENVAVVNLSEDGLSTKTTTSDSYAGVNFFNMGKSDISSGDVVMLQMGHNETSADEYKANLDYYRAATEDGGATFVLCSPIQRLNGSESVNDIFTPAAKEYADANPSVKYIDLNKLTGDLNAELANTSEYIPWYLHIAYWQAGTPPTAKNDATHLNDYGADQTCNLAMTALQSLVSGVVNDTIPSAIMPAEAVMKNNSASYVMPPYQGNNEVFPYPAETVFEHEVELSDEVVADGKLTSIKVTRNVALSYITVFAEVYDNAGTKVGEAVTKRLEAGGALLDDTVDFTNDNIVIPAGGKAVVYVCDGAASENTLNTDKVLSEIYEIKSTEDVSDLPFVGIKGTDDAENKTYTWTIGSGEENKTYTDTNDIVNLTVSLGSGDSMSSTDGIYYSATAVPDNGSVANRYLLVEPKHSGMLTVNVTASGASNNRLYYYDFGTDNVDLTKCTKSAAIAKQLTANTAADVEIVMEANHKYVVYPYTNKGAGKISAAKYTYTDTEIEVTPDGLDKKYMHISFDDVYACIKDITDNKETYTSVFDNDFLASLKTLHDNYGAVFTLNCFIKTTKDSSYDISNLPDTYAEELAANADWLKFAFHAQDDNAIYGETTGTSSGKLATVSETKASYKKFTDVIMKATGNNKSSIDTVTRLGFFSGGADNIAALSEGEYGITGLLTADDSRLSYYFDSFLNSHVNKYGYHYDSDKKLKLIKTITRLEGNKDVSSFTTSALDAYSGNMIEVFTHESEYLNKEAVRTNLENAIKWAVDKNYGFGYAMYLIEPKTQEEEQPKPDNEPIQIVSEETREGKIYYSLKVINVEGGTLITAVYNSDNSLYSVNMSDTDGDVVETTVDAPDDNTANIKFMLWDGIDTMEPLAIKEHTYTKPQDM